MEQVHVPAVPGKNRHRAHTQNHSRQAPPVLLAAAGIIQLGLRLSRALLWERIYQAKDAASGDVARELGICPDCDNLPCDCWGGLVFPSEVL